MGEDRIRGNSAGASGWVTTQVAAEALGVDPRTVRTYISRGILKAKVEGEGVEKAYNRSRSLRAVASLLKYPRVAEQLRRVLHRRDRVGGPEVS